MIHKTYIMYYNLHNEITNISSISVVYCTISGLKNVIFPVMKGVKYEFKGQSQKSNDFIRTITIFITVFLSCFSGKTNGKMVKKPKNHPCHRNIERRNLFKLCGST